MVESTEATAAVHDSGVECGVRWEKFTPRVSMKVLLVESDNSTRQIIAALLRKCSYTVSATSDGFKAWEILKENPQNVDLVLTEMELPSISGFTLLTMVMDHETYKNIPVIMMSSHDSISTVFKCMLKGAADFLVKPIRRNELKNLWQHVWRRQITSSQDDGGGDGHLDEKLENKSLNHLENKSLNDRLRGNVVFMQENMECSEKGSDAQSSCTIEMEGESTYLQSILETKQRKGSDISLRSGTVALTGEHNVLSHNESPMQEGELEDKPTMLDREKNCLDGMYKSNEPTPYGDRSPRTIEAADEEKSFEEAIDLIGGMDKQLYVQRSTTAASASDVSESNAYQKNSHYKSISMPRIELYSRLCQHSSCYKTHNGELSTLNYSTPSAFSQYNKRTLVLSLGMTTDTESRECFATSKAPTHHGSNSTTNAPQTPNVNREDPVSFGLEHTSPRVTDRCSPHQVDLFTALTVEMTSDNLCHGDRIAMQPVDDPQAAHRSWNSSATQLQEAGHTNLSHQSNPISSSSMQYDNREDNTSKSVIHDRAQKQDEIKELAVEQREVSYTPILNRHHPNITGSGSSCDKNKGYTNGVNNPQAEPESGNAESQFAPEGIKLTDLQRFNQREAALNKFRLKRKERCFEKKVRYHSRQRLAEQRPRVKGQFVRQIQTDSETSSRRLNS